ncbi:MAG: hypothetical protein AAB692_02935 [Patescibacteria group bacterium]
MSDSHYANAILVGWKRILLFGIITGLFGTGLSFLFPLEYSSSMRLLIIQKQLNQADPYTAIRASERIADNLGQIIYTTSFFDKVMNAKFNVDKTVFSSDALKRRNQWNRMITTQVIRDSGLLAVSVYHADKEQATQIARAIAFVLTTEGWQYVGGGDLQVILVDEPLQSRFPVRPNVPANALMGFVLGSIAGVGYVLVTEQKRNLFGISV